MPSGQHKWNELLANNRRRGKGSLEKAQRRAWQAIEFATAGMEKAAEAGDDIEVRKWIHALTQTLNVYSKLVLDSDMEQRLKAVEANISSS